MTAAASTTRIVADGSLRRRDRGRILIGGAPLRFVRITEAGARIVDGWLRNEPLGPAAGEAKLARRLIEIGMVHPDPPERPADLSAELTIIIPVKDDAEGLARTLASLGSTSGGPAILVVDDGSAQPMSAGGADADVVRRAVAGGPGVARSTGLATVRTPLVAFVDAGVELDVSDLGRLVRWFADPEVVAVAPRIASSSGDGVVATYEERHSPLDLGIEPANVGDGPVTYVPTACLVARTTAVTGVGGFDPALRWGEDVDLVWRLLDRGLVRYDPSVVANHPPRASVAAFSEQRRGYGSAAGPLAQRHPDRLAPIHLSGWSLACWALAFAGRPLAGLGLAAWTAAALARKLDGTLPDHRVEAVVLSAQGHTMAGRHLARAAVRTWWPISAAAFALGARRPVARILALAALDRWLATRDPRHTALAVLDDLAYGTGVLQGALQARTPRPLLPRLITWPPR